LQGDDSLSEASVFEEPSSGPVGIVAAAKKAKEAMEASARIVDAEKALQSVNKPEFVEYTNASFEKSVPDHLVAVNQPKMLQDDDSHSKASLPVEATVQVESYLDTSRAEEVERSGRLEVHQGDVKILRSSSDELEDQQDRHSLVVLIAICPESWSQVSNQEKAMAMLRAKGIRSELVVNSDPTQKARRDELFAISGNNDTYPQFFLVTESGSTHYLGDFAVISAMIESGSLREQMGTTRTSFQSESTLFTCSTDADLESLKSARKKALLVLVTNTPSSSEEAIDQEKGLALLASKGIQPELVVASDPAQLATRNELFDISRIQDRYPQFFFSDEFGKIIFLGDVSTMASVADWGTVRHVLGIGQTNRTVESREQETLPTSIMMPGGITPDGASRLAASGRLSGNGRIFVAVKEIRASTHLESALSVSTMDSVDDASFGSDEPNADANELNDGENENHINGEPPAEVMSPGHRTADDAVVRVIPVKRLSLQDRLIEQDRLEESRDARSGQSEGMRQEGGNEKGFRNDFDPNRMAWWAKNGKRLVAEVRGGNAESGMLSASNRQGVVKSSISKKSGSSNHVVSATEAAPANPTAESTGLVTDATLIPEALVNKAGAGSMPRTLATPGSEATPSSLDELGIASPTSRTQQDEPPLLSHMVDEVERLSQRVHQYEKKLQAACNSLVAMSQKGKQDERLDSLKHATLVEKFIYLTKQTWYKEHTHTENPLTPSFLACKMPESNVGSTNTNSGSSESMRNVIGSHEIESTKCFRITSMGKAFLEIDGPVQADTARFLSSFQSEESLTMAGMKSNWDLVVRVSRDAQSRRIRYNLELLINFCMEAHLIEE
jgi:hypothetical protein